MSSYEPGSRVLAVRNQADDAEILYCYGEGIYVGDRLLPDSEPIPGAEAETILEMFREDDRVPVDQHKAVEFARNAAASMGFNGDVAATEVMENIQIDRAKPMEERVRELWLSTRMNPCIHLDNGFVIWGNQCWWGPPERWMARFPQHELVQVPVPEGNARWQE